MLPTNNLDGIENNFKGILQQIEKKLEGMSENDATVNDVHFWTPFVKQIDEVVLGIPTQLIDILPLYIMRMMIREFDPNFYPKKRDLMMEMVGVRVTPKDKKKGSPGVFMRLLHNYHKPQVRKNVQEFVIIHAAERAEPLKEATKEEYEDIISQMIDDLGFSAVWIITEKILKDPEKTEAVKRVAPNEYLETVFELFDFYREVDYESLLSANYVARTVKHQSMKKEHAQLKKELLKKEKETKALKKEMHTVKVEKKLLEGDLHQLYEDSIKEIEALHQQMNEERVYFSNVIESLNQKIQYLKQQVNENEANLIQEEIPKGLEGKTIAIIGGDRVRHFQEVVEKYNGRLEFASESDLALVEGAVFRSDVVFFLKEFAGHHLYRRALQSATKKGIPFRYVNTKGVSGFERTLLSFMESAGWIGEKGETTNNIETVCN